jgi:hypothetical protein
MAQEAPLVPGLQRTVSIETVLYKSSLREAKLAIKKGDWNRTHKALWRAHCHATKLRQLTGKFDWSDAAESAYKSCEALVALQDMINWANQPD